MLEFASVWVSFCFPLYFFWGILSEKKDFDNCVLKRTPLFSHLLTFSAFEEMKERLLEEMETQKALRLEIEELDQTASKYAELKKRHEQEITKMQNKVGRGGLRMHVCAYECACCCVNDLNSLWSPPLLPFHGRRDCVVKEERRMEECSLFFQFAPFVIICF